MSSTASASSSVSKKEKSNNYNKDEWKDMASGYSEIIPRLTSLYAIDLIMLLYDDIKKAKIILDIGCGTGAFALAYQKIFPTGICGQTLISSDLSPAMLEQAKSAVMNGMNSTNECQTQFVFQVEDGTKLDGIDDDSIDVVVSVFGVFLIPDQVSALSSIQRVLKKKKKDDEEKKKDDIISNNETAGGGIFGNISWTDTMTNIKSSSSSLDVRHDSLQQDGFGHNMQYLFQLMILATNGKSSIPLPGRDWVEPETIREKLTTSTSTTDASIRFEDIHIHRSLHSLVWPNGGVSMIWSLFQKTPFANMAKASQEQINKAKQDLYDACGVQNDDEALKTPILMWTASNLTITRVSYK